MKIILVYLGTNHSEITGRTDWIGENLGISYLAAVLRNNNFPVITIDGAGEKLTTEQVLSRIVSLSPDFIGFSVTHLTIKEALFICKEIKKIKSSVHICFGGQHATLSAEQILINEMSVDSIIRGEGEISLTLLLDALVNQKDLIGISGVWFRDQSGQLMKNEDRTFIRDLDNLPFPARDLSKTRRGQSDYASARLWSSRGCIWNCSFCSTPSFLLTQENSPTWRFRSAINIVDEIETLYLRYGYTDFSFSDDNFVIPSVESKERLTSICNEIIRRGLKISIFIMCSALTFSSDDYSLLKLMREAGFERILLGIEAGCQSTLKLYNKPATSEQNITAIDLLSAFGFGLLCSTISIHPYTTIDELEINYQYIYELIQKPNVAMFAPYCTRLEVYPGSLIYSKLLGSGLLLTEKPYLDACSYKFLHPSIRFLAEKFRILQPKIVSVDWLTWDVRHWLLKNREFLIAHSGLDKQIDQINRLNYDFFMEVLTLSRDQDMIMYDKTEKEYLAILMKLQNDLLDSFHKITMT